MLKTKIAKTASHTLSKHAISFLEIRVKNS